jgi:hypothetical protein
MQKKPKKADKNNIKISGNIKVLWNKYFLPNLNRAKNVAKNVKHDINVFIVNFCHIWTILNKTWWIVLKTRQTCTLPRVNYKTDI